MLIYRAENEERLPAKEAKPEQSTEAEGKPRECRLLENREECFKESISMILLLKVWTSDQQLWPHLRA